jgi:hypothetical protein
MTEQDTGDTRQTWHVNQIRATSSFFGHPLVVAVTFVAGYA